ncbi:hypothetical protein K7X08_036676 [Anisodus acutangulus]|uniref:FBD domain-containing protein n=1 Tax=Anisodus acutangulus TaxID=402998 RepID=A0A9Q1QWH8_9SOLA|nr:hypothetical protein K7X08_036676 [Anisodus acutangulus]
MQLTETTAEMKAALQLIHLSRGDSNDGDNSKVVTVKEEEKESSDVYRMKKRKFRYISSLYQDTDAGSGSKLPIRDEEDHRLKQGKPKKRKFHSISDLYKYTDRLSSVEDEYNWSIPAGENPNMNISIKEDSGIGTNKKNAEIRRYNDYSEMNIAMLGPGEVPKVLPSSLNCLKRLYLSEICLEELVEVAWALCLIRSSPYLEELEIKGPGDLFGEWLAHVPPGGVNEIPASFSDLT